jgi:hypothetical protein
MKTEAQFSKHICQQLKKHGIPHQRLEVTTGAGVPDLCIFYKGETIWLELKSKTYALRAEQVVFAKRAAQQGVQTFSLHAMSEHGREPCDMHTHMELFTSADAFASKSGKSWRVSREGQIALFSDFKIINVLDACHEYSPK